MFFSAAPAAPRDTLRRWRLDTTTIQLPFASRHLDRWPRLVLTGFERGNLGRALNSVSPPLRVNALDS